MKQASRELAQCDAIPHGLVRIFSILEHSRGRPPGQTVSKLT
jgi:hypothetical protein